MAAKRRKVEPASPVFGKRADGIDSRTSNSSGSNAHDEPCLHISEISMKVEDVQTRYVGTELLHLSLLSIAQA